jgi:HK97 family phage major capsid protein
VAAALAPWSITMQAGLTVFDGLVADVQIPRASGTGAAQWLATETTTGTAAEATFTAAGLRPKSAIGIMNASGRLLQQTPLAEVTIARELARVSGLLVDAAVIAGTSTDNSVPLGLLYQSGVVATTGTSLTYANVLNEQEQIALGNVQDGAHAWVGHPTVRELLSQRAVGTSAGIAPYIWQDDKVVNRPAHVTHAVGTGRIVHGDWTQVVAGFWGPGFQIEHNPYAGFQSDLHAFRICVSCDVGVLSTGAVRVLTGIT